MKIVEGRVNPSSRVHIVIMKLDPPDGSESYEERHIY